MKMAQHGSRNRNSATQATMYSQKKNTISKENEKCCIGPCRDCMVWKHGSSMLYDERIGQDTPLSEFLQMSTCKSELIISLITGIYPCSFAP